MRKSTLASLLTIFLLIPATLFLGTQVKGRWYYLISTMIIIELMLPFFFRFEARRPQARELVILTVMAALAAVSRMVFAFSPYLKTITGIIMITGIAFGPEAGFLVGAVGAMASNFFYGQGPYTPWQMMAYGAGGMLAGFAFGEKRLQRKPLVMGIFGFFGVLLFVGPLLDTCTVFLTVPSICPETAAPIYLSGLPVNFSQGACTFLTMLLLGSPLLEKLDRIKQKYGMMEGEHGL